ncbi:right-handed parallel beta-helix repeat-containing protein [Segetibacter koreensis]|uniref:right-handed parallel beta-helix repeat-containing protein n=1 Tax=Segetibacter koreensis TaxID=398037 RepID=UPI000367AE60|nr:right-handed parallel beta-helix repeat-containing protein [Segetibacter koreensis]
MKQIFLSIILFQTFLCCTGQTNFYVAVNGNDNNAGTLNKPFKTIETALDKVGIAKENKVRIWLRSGRYGLSKTLEITAELLKDRQLQILPYNNEQVTISGAVKINPEWKTYKGQILQASIDTRFSIDRLLCNGTPLNMARYPNFDSSIRVFNGWAADAISPQRVKNWSHPEGGYLHALHQAEWGDFHYRITGKTDRDSLSLEGGWQNNRPAPMHKEYRFVENIFEELDAPGEWYYNASSGILYLYPPRGVNLHTALFERSVLDNIIRIKGTEQKPVSNVTIKGITFTGTNRTFMLTKERLLRTDWTIYRGGAVITEGVKNINISNCTFNALGGHAIFVSKYNRNVLIEHNYIHNIGGNAIAFVGDTAAVRSPAFGYESFVPLDKMDMTPGPKTNNYPAACKAYDNLIHTIGTVEKQVAGVEIDMAMNITVSHNTIYHVPRAGINVGDGCWGGHMIEFNDVFNTVLETGDHGAYNSWGRDRYWLPSISAVDSNVEKFPDLPLLDVIKPITLRNNRFYCAHGWDIDLDDGSSNYRIYNNLCLNGGLKLREGYYRVVENNIVVNNTFHPHVWYTGSMDVFAHNIVTAEYAPIRISVWGKEVDHNFFIQKTALAAAQKKGTDEHSLQGNPQFVDDAGGDFRVMPTSKALSIGFKNFPMNDFGVVSSSLKQKAQKAPIAGVRTLAVEKKGLSTEWLGAIIKNVETPGEQSASGLPDKEGVLIVKVSRGSFAEKSGLEAGDVIREINGKPVANVAEMLNSIQVIMWQGGAQAAVLHNQQMKNVQLHFK